MMPVIMFWNVQGGPRFPMLQTACIERNVDILILAEDRSLPGRTEAGLNAPPNRRPYREFAPGLNTVRTFSRLPQGALSLVSDLNGRVSIRSFKPVGGLPLLIAAAHSPSKLHSDADDQRFFATRMKNAIDEAEKGYGHQNSIVIGDLNMNPFELGMTAFDGLHAVMDKNDAVRSSRMYRGETSDFFYNPMWSRLGDESVGPPGTYYRNSSSYVNHYWHTFDQILLRPSLLPFYKSQNLQVITRIGADNLIKHNRIDSSISDHLPIVIDPPIEGAVL